MKNIKPLLLIWQGISDSASGFSFLVDFLVLGMRLCLF